MRRAILRALGAAAAMVVFRRRRPRPAEPAREPLVEPEVKPGAGAGAELVVSLLLLAAAGGAIGFAVFYLVDEDTQLLGLCLGLALLLAGIASALAGKRVVLQEKASEEYHEFGDAQEQRRVDAMVDDAALGITRRRLLFSALAASGAALGAAAAFPVASLGPSVGDRVYETPWEAGLRVVDEVGEPIAADDIEEGEFLTGFPEGAPLDDIGSPVIIVRLAPDEIELPPERAAGAPEGIVAYSKICTHAGCAVSMYRYPLYAPSQPGPALVCPCHYSTFNPADGGSVKLGPAGRPLPQLPLRIGADGTLEAAGDFYEHIGPSYGGIREHEGRLE